MRRFIGYFSFVILFICQTVSAQNTPELVSSGALIGQGTKLNDDGKYKEAIELYSKVSRSDTNYSSALHELAYSCYLDSQFDASIKYAKEGLKLFPEKADDWYSQLANTYDALNKHEEAISYYDSSIKLNPYSSLAWFNKGIAFFNLDSLEKAEVCFQKAILINPYHPSSHYYLGVVCYRQGMIPQAILSFTMNLIINPQGRYMSNSVNFLNSLSRVTDEVNTNASKAVQTTDDDFSLQQEIILSKAALDPKYKLRTDVEDPITRQLQVLFEKTQYNAGDKGFWMQYYVPFYTQVYKNGEFNTLVNYIFSGLDIKSVKSYNQKNKKDIDALTTEAGKYLDDIRRTEAITYTDRTADNYKYYFGDDGLSGIGKWRNDGKDNILFGPWEFYYDDGQLRSKGNLDDNSNKTGEWMFYHGNGNLKEKTTYVNDQAEGNSTGWFDNGNISEQDVYKQGKLNGEIKTYFFNAMPKTIEHYTDDQKNEEMKAYTFDGFLNYVANYKNDEEEGLATLYYKNGKTKEIKNYSAGKLNGAYKHYSEKGFLDMEGSYSNDKPAGQWKEYYDSNVIKAEYAYSDGGMDGIYKSYFENGKLSETISYSNGKMDGKEEDFDEDGIKYGEATYEKGRLRELVFFDKTGKVINSSTTRKGAADLTFFDADGNKTSEGYYNKDGYADGKSTYYFKSGKIKSELTYKSGARDGIRTLHYLDGTISEKLNFTDDKEDGLLTAYYPNGKLKYAGNYVAGDKQGEHQKFNAFGTPTSTAYFLNDELDGYVVYYSANGKKENEEKYRTGWLVKMTQFDSTGKIISESSFPGGNGELVYKHFNGNIMMRVSYRNYLMHGKYESFYFDGTPSYIRYYTHGLEDSSIKKYFYNGKPEYEGNYSLGKKEGVWKYYFDGGQLSYTENYSDDELNGTKLVFNEDGTKDKEINYKDDMMEGACKIYGIKNELAVQLNFHKGELVSYTYEGKDGNLVAPVPVKNGTALVTAYYKNGNKSVEINYEENVENGVRKIYFSNGQIYVDDQRTYDDENGPKKTYYPDGKTEKEENFYYGNMHGIQKAYYSNASVKSEENWYDGEQNGISKYYDESGKLKETRVYYYGTLLSVNK
jgi:antitoxin component YwqK of YwqJK toxin-antitoxin module